MNGIFKKSFFKFLLSSVWLILSSFFSIKFALWGLNSLNQGQVAMSIFLFICAAIGLLIGSLSIIIFNFNRNAYITMENGKLDAEFGIWERIHTDISKIQQAELINRNFLQLLIDDKSYWISGLTNAKEICEYILQRIPPVKHQELDEVQKIYEKLKKKYTRLLVITIILSGLLFVNIGWCVILTEGKSPSFFSEMDNHVFLAFTIIECTTLIMCFFFANKCGKSLSALNSSKKVLLSAAAEKYKQSDLDMYPNIIKTRFFDHYTYRVIIFSTGEVFAYMLERYNYETSSWRQCYDSAKGFVFLTDLFDELDITFEDIIWDE